MRKEQAYLLSLVVFYRDIDQFCGQCLEDLRHPEKNDLNAENFSSIIFENFTTTLSDGSKVELIEGGSAIDVT